MNCCKLELGCGDRPTEGYLHQDITKLIPDLDFHCQPYEVDMPENSLDEVIAIGVMEHLTFQQFEKTIQHIHKLLKPYGIFLFDVPNLFVWSGYLYKVLRGEPVPFTKEHIYSTFWGWQRWEGDEHKSMWTIHDLLDLFKKYDFRVYNNALEHFIDRGIKRNRFNRPEDAHYYIKAVKK